MRRELSGRFSGERYDVGGGEVNLGGGVSPMTGSTTADLFAALFAADPSAGSGGDSKGLVMECRRPSEFLARGDGTVTQPSSSPSVNGVALHPAVAAILVPIVPRFRWNQLNLANLANGPLVAVCATTNSASSSCSSKSPI